MEKTTQMTKLFNFRLILFVALSYIVGIATVYFIVLSKIFWAITFILVFSACLVLFIIPFSKKENRKASIIFSVVFLLFFALGGLNFYVRVENFSKADLGGSYYHVSGKVVDVKDTAYGKRYIIKNASVKGKQSGILRYKIATFVNGASDYDIGDFIEFSANLNDKTIVYEDKFSAYDVADKIKYTVSLSAEEVSFVKNDKNVFEKTNVFIRESLRKGLSDNGFSIAYAMLTGHDEYMDEEVLSSYRMAGVAHIFAVSGLHIGFVATVLNYLFDKLRFKRIIKAFIIIAVLIFYSGVCGFSASSLRATIMSAILLFSAIGGDRYDKYVSVSTASLLVLMISPIQLFCVGFQLSFTVVTAMLLLTAPLSKMLKFLPRKVSSSLSAVLSAQVAGIPICLWAFNEFSLISILANLLFIPIVGVVFVALMVGVFVGGLFNICTVALFLQDKALYVINAIITAFDYRAFIVGGFALGGFIIFYYSALITASGFVNLKRKTRVITSLSMALVCIIGTIGITAYEKNRTYAFVLGSYSISATFISSNTENYLIVSDANEKFNLNRLKRIATKRGKTLDGVVVLNGAGINAQALVSRLSGTFRVNKVYYYGDNDRQTEIALLYSFPYLTVENFYDDKTFGGDKITFNFALDGRALEISCDDKKSAVFSNFENKRVEYASLKDEYYLAVYLDAVESVASAVSAEEEISYRRSFDYKDAESSGNRRVLMA